MHFHVEGDEHHRQDAREPAIGRTESNGSAVRGVRLCKLSQTKSGQNGTDGTGGEVGTSASRLRGRREADSQRPRFTALNPTSADRIEKYSGFNIASFDWESELLPQ